MFMQLVQIPECGGFDLTWADRLRKSIAKKNPAEYEQLTKEYFEQVEEKKLSKKLCNYVWNVLVATSRGYGFNKSHTLAYSIIGLQELNLGYRFPIEFWNCACLITDSGGIANTNQESDIASEDDEDDEDDNNTAKDKHTINYGKIATAIGKMKMAGIEVTPPDINDSTFTFSPDEKNHIIRYGLSGISRIGRELVTQIIKNQPYFSMADFLEKIKITKPQMVNLIKSGAFDKFFLGDREQAMASYIKEASKPKKRVTLQNMAMLINFNLLPETLDFEKRLFNFNKYLKKFKDNNDYLIDNIAYNFYEKNFDIDILQSNNKAESGFSITQTAWDKIYQKGIDGARTYIKKHSKTLLEELNNCLFKELLDKYAEGNISKWEMDSISYYYHEHELSEINDKENGLSNFFELKEEPVIDRILPIKGKKIPLFKIYRIAGTILDKDKNKNTITLLTKEGVVTVKIFGQVFSYYDKQLSERGADGKKHVIEKSFLSRGNKIVATGIRRGNDFICKKYKSTPYHIIEKIIDIDENGIIATTGKRVGDTE